VETGENMKCEDLIDELQKSLDKTLEKQKCSNCQHDFKPKVHLLNEITKDIEVKLMNWIRDSDRVFLSEKLRELRYESIKWRHELTDKVNPVDEVLKKEGHPDWIV